MRLIYSVLCAKKDEPQRTLILRQDDAPKIDLPAPGRAVKQLWGGLSRTTGISEEWIRHGTQASAWKAAGCERIYGGKRPGRWDRSELPPAPRSLCEDDGLMVCRGDRLSRSLRDVLTVIEPLTETRAGFRSLTEAIDTTAPAGRMMMQMVGTSAELEAPGRSVSYIALRFLCK